MTVGGLVVKVRLRFGGHDRGEPHGERGQASDQVTPFAGVNRWGGSTGHSEDTPVLEWSAGYRVRPHPWVSVR